MFRQAHARWRYGSVLLLSLGLLRCAPAQDAAGDTVYHVHGTVVNGRTGQPLARALVVSQDRRLATMTNGEGRFDVDVSVPAEQVQWMRRAGAFGAGLGLLAQKPGFVPQVQPMFLSLDETVSATDLTLKLMPAGVIAGSVSTPTDDAPEGVRLLLLHRMVQDGEARWLPAGMRRTNRRGEFRFGNLSPGEYTVLAMEYRPDGEMPGNAKEVSQRYLPDYCGDADNLGSAGKLKLQYGDTVQAELHLRLGKYYPVKISVATIGDAPVFARVGGTDADAYSGFQLSYNARDRSLEGALPDGSYTLLINSFGQQQSFARVPFQVAGAPVHGGPIALAAGGTIAVHVHSELAREGASQPPMVHVSLRPRTFVDWYVSGPNRPGQEENFTLENVHPGEYVVTADTSQGYVAALSSGQTDLLQHPLSVDASGAAPDIEVVVRDDGASVKGTVKAESGAIPARTFAFLLPVDAGRMTQALVGSDGSFAFSNIAPGTYRLLATTNAALQIPFRDAEAMRAYDGMMSTVTVGAGESVSAEAPLIDSLDGGIE